MAIARADRIEHCIFLVRGHKVMLDSHLATLYGVETKSLNKAVKRNFDRFPPDFMFQLEVQEVENLKFQIGTSSLGHGGRRYAPFAFTEQGVGHAVQRLAQQTGSAGQCRHHAGLCPAARDADSAQGARQQTG